MASDPRNGMKIFYAPSSNDTKLYPMINNTKPIQMPLFPMFYNDPAILYEYFKFQWQAAASAMFTLNFDNSLRYLKDNSQTAIKF